MKVLGPTLIAGQNEALEQRGMVPDVIATEVVVRFSRGAFESQSALLGQVAAFRAGRHVGAVVASRNRQEESRGARALDTQAFLCRLLRSPLEHDAKPGLEPDRLRRIVRVIDRVGAMDIDM